MKKLSIVLITLTFCFIAQTTFAARKVGGEVSCKFKAGHPSAGCSGDIPLSILGLYWIHVPCVGDGSDCEWETKITIGRLASEPIDPNTPYNDGKLYFYNGDYNESHFSITSKSFYLEDENLYVNVPGQLIEKYVDYQYSLSGVTFTTAPLFAVEDEN